ncbi:MAG: MFS transporter [Acidimicrobiales bacterium]
MAAVVADEQVERTAGASRWAVLAVLCLSLLVTGIDGTIVNVALPTLVRDLGTSASQLQWVVDAYTIIFASFLLIAGNTGDRLGRKGCFIGGLVVFGSGSLACSLVHSAGTLILMRGLQGFGAAFIMPATLSILINVFGEPGERARAISIWAGVSGLGVAIGPLAGGFLLQHFWWGSIFLVNVPIVAAAIVGAIAIVPNSRDAGAPRLDLLGTVLSTTGLLALLYGIIEGPSAGWGRPTIAGAFVLAGVLLAAFVLWEQRCDHPILEVSFFANPRFTAASVAVTLVFFAMFGALFFISQFLQFVLGYDPFHSGLALLPVAGVLMVTAPASAKLVARYGTKLVVTGGLVVRPRPRQHGARGGCRCFCRCRRSFRVLAGPGRRRSRSDRADRRGRPETRRPAAPQPGRSHPRPSRGRRHVQPHLQRRVCPLWCGHHHAAAVLDLAGRRRDECRGRSLRPAPGPRHGRLAP